MGTYYGGLPNRADTRVQGPFQGKNFATTVSAWVVTLEALKPFMAPLPERLKPEYSVLSASTNQALDAHLAVEIVSKGRFGLFCFSLQSSIDILEYRKMASASS